MVRLEQLDASIEENVVFLGKLYTESFPANERRPFKLMLEAYKSNSHFSIEMIYKGQKLAGFITCWDLGDFVFAEHFAIAPQARNGGIGAKVIELFLNSIEKPVILEVETPETELAKRRIQFYKRLGLKLWDKLDYKQPSFVPGDTPVSMILMTHKKIDIEGNFEEIKKKIYHDVYLC